MAFTTVAFYESANNATLDYISALSDEHVTVSGNDITVPDLNQVVLVAGLQDAIQYARIETPSLRRMWLEDIFPLTHAYTFTAADEQIADYKENPLPLVTAEKLNFLMQHAAGAADYMVGLVWLADGALTPVTGEIHTIRASVDTAPTAYEWSASTLSFEQTLPAGRYQVVGGTWEDANGIAARLLFVGYSWRPAFIALDKTADQFAQLFRRGNIGVFGEFEFDQPPQVELLSTGTTTGDIYLDLIQVRAGR